MKQNGVERKANTRKKEHTGSKNNKQNGSVDPIVM